MLAACLTTPATAQTRIACLGDSITFGARIADREHSSYPNWLDDFLGDDHQVRNFGVGGATLLYDADRPFAKTKAFRDAKEWRPDIAVIALGTNDTCENDRRTNWRHHESLPRDAQRLVAELHGANPDMRIVLCSPTPMFPDQRGLAPARKQDLVTRSERIATCALAMQRVARTTARVDYLELRHAIDVRHVSDGVHPTAFGAERIARRVAEALANPRTNTATQRRALTEQLAQRKVPSKPDTFHGFDGVTFTLPKTTANCRVYFPRGTAPGTPWILRARFFGHQPALDIALLERGFHLVYCDVSNLYGSQAAIDRYAELHALLDAAGFHRRAVLEGMSRGGLQIVNWALAYPHRVAAIYGDNPVFDIRSWPGGNSGKRSDADWQRCLAAYGLDEQSAVDWQPLSATRFGPLAKEGVPLLLVLGTGDRVVPPKENGELLAQRYREASGHVDVWRKPGLGHHPHGLSPVDPLLRAILRATGHAKNIATAASPSVEYRTGAGWHGDSWRTQVEKMRALAKQNPTVPIVFFGDSITQGLTGSRDRLTKKDGKRAIDRAFGMHGAISLGLSGDRTEHLLWRMKHGALQELQPKVIVLQIGVNNVVTGKHTATEVLDGILEVAEQLTVQEPSAEVVICGPFPAGARDSVARATIDRIRSRLQAASKVRGLHGAFGQHAIRYVDLAHLFVDGDGRCNDNMRSDRIHISAAGQTAWMQALQPIVEQVLQDR